MTLPIRISVRVDFDDGTQHDYEVRGPDAVPAPAGFWPEGVVTSDVAQRIDYARKRAEEIKRLRGKRDGAIRLLETALFLRQNGERPPGAPHDDPEAETWRDWERKAEEFLRGLLPGAGDWPDRGTAENGL